MPAFLNTPMNALETFRFSDCDSSAPIQTVIDLPERSSSSKSNSSCSRPYSFISSWCEIRPSSRRLSFSALRYVVSILAVIKTGNTRCNICGLFVLPFSRRPLKQRLVEWSCSCSHPSTFCCFPVGLPSRLLLPAVE